jgi:hypothetical protein
VTAGREPGACPRCGADVEPGQEYCLDCGLRLPGPGLAASAGSAWRERVGRRGPSWLWPILAALAVAAAMTGVAIVISRSGDEDRAFFEATGPATVSVSVGEPTEPPTTASPTETVPPTTAPTTTAAPRPEIVEWPPSQNGYTVVIASLPTSGGRALAIRKAREALRSDLPEVGVLDSGEFSSLHPGYYVVFSGIYADQRGALGGVGRVQRLYPASYIRQISR